MSRETGIGPAVQRMPSVAIVGAGMSGICMAVRLLQEGFDDVVLYEAASDLGGTWRDNTYPGLSCDVPSRTYQYSFALSADWTHRFASGSDIHQYFAEVADRHNLRARIEFDTTVQSAHYRDGRWSIRTSRGPCPTVDFLILATGVLRIPHIPDIDGAETFRGSLFHSARWDHDVPLDGRRIGVVGSGSTGAQIVTALAETSDTLALFQRTPHWVLPIPNRSYRTSTHVAYRRIPGLRRLGYLGMRFCFDAFSQALIKPGWRRKLVGAACRANLRTIRDVELRRALTPAYEPMCKRLVVSAGFCPAVQRDDVTLVTDAIDHVEPRGVVTADGTLHELDVLVLATGFDAHAFMRPMHVTGQDGVTIDEAWRQGPRAFNTVSVPGFPNMFILMGPHSPVGNYTLTAIAETQVDHILQWVKRWRDREFDTVAPTEHATAKMNDEMSAALPQTVWASGCDSWYLGADGRPQLWPWRPSDHRRRLATPSEADYVLDTVDRGVG